MLEHGKGFTLIELLVVIGIIAVLVSILLPSLGSAKSMARSTDCMSNIRFLGLGVQMYAGDYDCYPAAWVSGSPVSVAWCGGYYRVGGVSHMDVMRSPLWPYLQERKMLWCKEFTPPTMKYPGSGQISGYGINSQYVAGNPVVNPADGQAGMSSYAKPARLNEVSRPAETILFADCARFKSGTLTEEIFIYPLYKHNSTNRNYATFHFRHAGAANAAYCNGVVGKISPLELEASGDGMCGWMGNEVMDRE